MKTKICGITTLKDAQLAYQQGAWAIGLNLYQQSLRHISLTDAKPILAALKDKVRLIGISIDHTSDQIIDLLNHFDYLQVYQDYPLPKAIKQRLILCIRPGEVSEIPTLDTLTQYAYVLLDTPGPELGGTGICADWSIAKQLVPKVKLILAGGLHVNNITQAIKMVQPTGVDVCSQIELTPGHKDPNLLSQFLGKTQAAGHFGPFGGNYAPETLITPLNELAMQYTKIKNDPVFQDRLNSYLKDYVGRPTPLTFAQNLTKKLGGAQIYLKREDLTHTGSHKINNCLAQGLLAKTMHKKRLIAETGAGQHGVATATVAALLGLECVVYMGAKDIKRQALNCARIKILGGTVVPVTAGTQTLKDATTQAMQDWVTHVKTSYYVIGSALGPHPYPTIVRDFQTLIGKEACRQVLLHCKRLPDELIACVGGGSNAIGLFYPFLSDQSVKMTGVEAGGKAIAPGQHAARFADKAIGVLQGTKTYLLQDENGNIQKTHSISAGLDYPAVGPEHAYLHHQGRVQYQYASDKEALNAAFLLAETEGIIPALESAHAIAYAIKRARRLDKDHILLVNLSGRGDKDVTTLINHLEGL